MGTAKKHAASRKAQHGGESSSFNVRPRAKPAGRGRAQAGGLGEGKFYEVEIRYKGLFHAFRKQAGGSSSIQRVTGKRKGGVWEDHKWLFSKEQAHLEDGLLVPDTRAAREILESLGSKPVHIAGDRFKAKAEPDLSGREKPAARKRAPQHNIKKAPMTMA